jgi:hypothetical protein
MEEMPKAPEPEKEVERESELWGTLLAALKEKSPEIKTILNRLLDEEEPKAEAKGSRGQIELSLKQARLYAEAGGEYAEYAEDNFKNAARQAWNEQLDDLFNAIIEEAQKLGLKAELEEF